MEYSRKNSQMTKYEKLRPITKNCEKEKIHFFTNFNQSDFQTLTELCQETRIFQPTKYEKLRPITKFCETAENQQVTSEKTQKATKYEKMRPIRKFCETADNQQVMTYYEILRPITKNCDLLRKIAGFQYFRSLDLTSPKTAFPAQRSHRL